MTRLTKEQPSTIISTSSKFKKLFTSSSSNPSLDPICRNRRTHKENSSLLESRPVYEIDPLSLKFDFPPS